MMELAYAPSLSDALIARLEEAARAVGLSLRRTELLGQDTTLAEGFVQSVQAGDHQRFLGEVDWFDLETRLAERIEDASAVDPISSGLEQTTTKTSFEPSAA